MASKPLKRTVSEEESDAEERAKNEKVETVSSSCGVSKEEARAALEAARFDQGEATPKILGRKRTWHRPRTFALSRGWPDPPPPLSRARSHS